jgi:hypothetical protein
MHFQTIDKFKKLRNSIEEIRRKPAPL